MLNELAKEGGCYMIIHFKNCSGQSVYYFALHTYIGFPLFSHLASLSQEAWSMSNYLIKSCVQIYA